MNKRIVEDEDERIYIPYNVNVDDFIDYRSRTNRPNTLREEIGKYYDVTNHHLVVNQKKVISGILDGSWD